jgi:hypothetical protein
MALNLRFSFPLLRSCLNLCLVLTALVCLPIHSSADIQVALTWDENSETDLAGYRLYARQKYQQYDYDSPAYDGSDHFYTISDLDHTVENCFVVRAYDITGNESADSKEVCQPETSIDTGDVDDDGDGFTENQGDCNDADTAIHPNASDACGDGIDQNCDGADPPCPADMDDDGDGFTENQGDCNDADAAIHPNASDACGDGIDQNCDGSDATCVAIKADAGPDQTVAINEMVTLNGLNSTSSDDGALSYSWRQTNGEQVQLSDPLGSTAQFEAPVAEQALEFDLTVTDSNGLTGSDSCIVNVSEQNEPPISLAGSDLKVQENQVVLLDGSGSMDDGEFLSYKWLQTAGPMIQLSDVTSPVPEFISPTVGSEGASLTFQLTVTDQGLLKDTDSCIVNVTSQNLPPEAITSEYQETTTASVVTLDGSLSADIDDGIDMYRWHQLEGPPVTFDNPKAARVNFSAPDAGPYGKDLIFALIVKDRGGLKKSAECTVYVHPNYEGKAPFTVTPTLILFEKGRSYQARATVIVIDDPGKAVKGAQVKGRWSLPGFDIEHTVVGQTTGAGEVKWDSERFVDGGTLSFTVTEISKDGISYAVDIENSMYAP